MVLAETQNSSADTLQAATLYTFGNKSNFDQVNRKKKLNYSENNQLQTCKVDRRQMFYSLLAAIKEC